MNEYAYLKYNNIPHQPKLSFCSTYCGIIKVWWKHRSNWKPGHWKTRLHHH